MAIFDEELSGFVAKWGEKSVASALKAYNSMRERQKVYSAEYAEKRKAKSAEKKANLAFAKEIAAATGDPAKLREVLAAHGVNL